MDGTAVRQMTATFGVSGAVICKALIRRPLTGDVGINPTAATSRAGCRTGRNRRCIVSARRLKKNEDHDVQRWSAFGRVYVRQLLAPTLGRGDGVALGEPAGHKGAGIREAIHAPLPALRLSPYGPDMNSMAFAKRKTLMRQQPATCDLPAMHHSDQQRL